MNSFKDKFEHSVLPASDYFFAIEKYFSWDSRYKVTKFFTAMIAEKKGVYPYNCKICIPGHTDSIFNVFVYFQDIREVFSVDTIKKLSWDTTIKQPYNEMFMEALKHYPVPELKNKEMNANGIFFQDFRECARSKSLMDAEPRLKNHWKENVPQIVFTVCQNDFCYLFFKNKNSLKFFCDEEYTYCFKNEAYKILKAYDKHNVWSIDSLMFRLDVYENYTNIGGHNYFNSDTMFSGKII